MWYVALQAKAQEQEINRRFEKVNKNLKRDLSTNYKIQVTDDIKSAITEYVKAQIQFEKQHLKKWESLRNRQESFSVDQSARRRTGSIGRTDERRAAQLLSSPS